MVAPTTNPSTWEARSRQISGFQASQGYCKNLSPKNNRFSNNKNRQVEVTLWFGSFFLRNKSRGGNKEGAAFSIRGSGALDLSPRNGEIKKAGQG